MWELGIYIVLVFVWVPREANRDKNLRANSLFGRRVQDLPAWKRRSETGRGSKSMKGAF